MSLLERLTTRLSRALDGEGGRPSPLAGLAKDLRLGDRLNQLADLGSATVGKGASLILISDAGALISATTVEGALAELATRFASIPTSVVLAGTGASQGASLIGIRDVGALITATTVEGALAELATAIAARSVAATLAATTVGAGATLIGIYDVGTLITATTVEGALAEIATKIAAIAAENTDGLLSLPLLSGTKDGGAWAVAITSGGLASVTRTAADAPDSWWVDVPLEGRTTALKGKKATIIKGNYTVATADVSDVRFELWKITQGSPGNLRTAAVLGGQTDGHYDPLHNTSSKRGDDTGAPEKHYFEVTIPTPAYLAAGESLKVRCFVDGDAGAAGIVAIHDLNLVFSETPNDIA